MNRTKTFDSTGVAPNGKLFAGDLNLIQDVVAALSDFAQTHDVSILRVGDATLTLQKFGAGELWFSSLLRVSGILRTLAGFVSGTYTTTQRDAIAGGSRPYGLVILNSTTNRYEFNSGTDAAPAWKPLFYNIVDADIAAGAAISKSKLAPLAIVDADVTGPISKSKLGALGIVDADITGPISGTKLDLAGSVHRTGTLAARPAPTGLGGQEYFASDEATLYRSDGSAWTKEAASAGYESVYRTIAHFMGIITGGNGGLDYALGLTQQTNQIPNGVPFSAGLWIDPSDHAVAGKTTKYRLRLTTISNATAPNASFNGKIRTLLHPQGGAGVVTNLISGDETTSASTGTVAVLSGGTIQIATSSDFTALAANVFIGVVNVSVALAANSAVQCGLMLQVRNT